MLTGLGIGGIAIAFAAQKTLENLFGGIMIISDQPIRVGDFCRAGDYHGVVEDKARKRRRSSGDGGSRGSSLSLTLHLKKS